MPLTGAIAALVTVRLWGVNFAAVKFAISEVPPLAVSAMRFAILSIVLLPFLRVRRDVFWRIVHYGLAMGIGLFTVLFIGMQSLDISTTGIVMQLGTPFVVLLAWLMLGEHFGIWRAAGMGVAFGGIVVLIGVPTAGVDPLWLLVLVASAFMWAYSSIRAKQIPNVNPFTLIAWMSVIVTPIIIGLSWIFEAGQIDAVLNATPRFWYSLAYMIGGSSIAAYGLWYWLLNRFDVTAVAPFNLLVPLVAVICGVAIMGDQLTVTKVIGGAMILGGVALITVRQIVVSRRAKVTSSTPGAPL